MKRALIFAALVITACGDRVERKFEQKPVQKAVEVEQPEVSDGERLARCRKRGEEFFSLMGIMGSPSCYITEKGPVYCQLPEPSKRKVHVIDCNYDGCNYRQSTEY